MIVAQVIHFLNLNQSEKGPVHTMLGEPCLVVVYLIIQMEPLHVRGQRLMSRERIHGFGRR